MLYAVLIAFAVAVHVAGPAAAQSPHTRDHSFGDAEKWARVFDDPKRDAWQKPHEVIQALALKTGGRVAVIDFRIDSPEGPPRAARIAPEQVKAELKRAGYTLDREHGFLPNQYFLVFRPAGP